MKDLETLEPWISNQDILCRLDWHNVFHNNNLVEVDLGAGDGGFVVNKALLNPETNFVATERLLGRARKIAKKILRENLRNLRVIRLESAYFLAYIAPASSLHRIHVMYPDPWPKRRHFKNRLIQPEFLAAAHQALTKGGDLRFTTDHEDYFRWTQKVFSSAPAGMWKELGPWDASSDPSSDFQKDFAVEGRSVFRASWEKL